MSVPPNDWSRYRPPAQAACCLALSILVTLLLASCSSEGSEVEPTPAGDPLENPLQLLINAAEPGATVEIPEGVYPGGVTIEKPLTLDGQGEAWVDADCKTDYGIDIEAGGVTLKDLGVRNALESNILAGEVTGVKLERLTLEDWNCADIEMQSNAGVACWYCSELQVLDSTMKTSRAFGNGVWVKSTSETPTTGGHVITGNKISGGFDGIGSEAEDDPMGGFVRDTLIANNEIIDCRDDGIQVEGRNEDIVVRENIVRGCGIGIAFAPNLVGPLLVERNLLEDMKPGYYDQQACFKVGDGGAGMAELRGNVCRSAGEGLKQTNAGLAPLSLNGNCIIVTSYAYYLTDLPGGDFSGNWLESPNPLLIRWGDDVFEGVPQFRNRIGEERQEASKAICSLPR